MTSPGHARGAHHHESESSLGFKNTRESARAPDQHSAENKDADEDIVEAGTCATVWTRYCLSGTSSCTDRLGPVLLTNGRRRHLEIGAPHFETP
jgi:hypothetical protein